MAHVLLNYFYLGVLNVSRDRVFSKNVSFLFIGTLKKAPVVGEYRAIVFPRVARRFPKCFVLLLSSARVAQSRALFSERTPGMEATEPMEQVLQDLPNVFGFIAADNLGYAKVALEQTIAEGHLRCRVVIYLQPTPEAKAARGREYFQG
jgi:hypothetical protein